MAPMKSSKSIDVSNQININTTTNLGNNLAAPSPTPFSATGGVITTYGGKTIHVCKSTTPFVCAGDETVDLEYVIIGGGASGGSSGTNAYGGGGGGAGQLRTGTASDIGAGTFVITVGEGGATAVAQNTKGNPGSNSSVDFPVGIVTAFGGGGGSSSGPFAVNDVGANGNNYPSPTNGSGSGGGAGKGYAGTTYQGGPAPLGAYPGGQCHPGAPLAYAGGGGGGAGGAGGAGPSSAGNVATPNVLYGYGGLAKQLPATFQDPATSPTGSSPAGTVGAPGPSGTHWVCGGGSGGLYGNPEGTIANGAKGGSGSDTGTGPFGGGGNGGGSSPTTNTGTAGSANTGSGGGGGGADVGEGSDGGAGGDGLVLIAYS